MKINGIVLINKARGKSSNNVVNSVKRILNADKVGHYGTLDVLGEGLLPVALGKGTKLFELFLNKDKVYRTTFIFGKTTETLDLEGDFINIDNKHITLNQVKAVLPKMIGKIEQMPPQFSAKKINGQRAYDLARAGKEVKLKPKLVEIYDIKLLREVEYNTFEFEIWCSSGTYIRSICRDMATLLSTYGVMSSIIRTRCGKFDLNDACTLENLSQDRIIKLEEITDYKKIKLSLEESKKILNGQTIDYNHEDGQVNCFYEENYLGICEIKDKKLKIKIRLCD